MDHPCWGREGWRRRIEDHLAWTGEAPPLERPCVPPGTWKSGLKRSLLGVPWAGPALAWLARRVLGLLRSARAMLTPKAR